MLTNILSLIEKWFSNLFLYNLIDYRLYRACKGDDFDEINRVLTFVSMYPRLQNANLFDILLSIAYEKPDIKVFKILMSYECFYSKISIVIKAVQKSLKDNKVDLIEFLIKLPSTKVYFKTTGNNELLEEACFAENKQIICMLMNVTEINENITAINNLLALLVAIKKFYLIDYIISTENIKDLDFPILKDGHENLEYFYYVLKYCFKGGSVIIEKSNTVRLGEDTTIKYERDQSIKKININLSFLTSICDLKDHDLVKKYFALSCVENKLNEKTAYTLLLNSYKNNKVELLGTLLECPTIYYYKKSIMKSFLLEFKNMPANVFQKFIGSKDKKEELMNSVKLKAINYIKLGKLTLLIELVPEHPIFIDSNNFLYDLLEKSCEYNRFNIIKYLFNYFNMSSVQQAEWINRYWLQILKKDDYDSSNLFLNEYQSINDNKKPEVYSLIVEAIEYKAKKVFKQVMNSNVFLDFSDSVRRKSLIDRARAVSHSSNYIFPILIKNLSQELHCNASSINHSPQCKIIEKEFEVDCQLNLVFKQENIKLFKLFDKVGFKENVNVPYKSVLNKLKSIMNTNQEIDFLDLLESSATEYPKAFNLLEVMNNADLLQEFSKLHNKYLHIKSINGDLNKVSKIETYINSAQFESAHPKYKQDYNKLKKTCQGLHKDLQRNLGDIDSLVISNEELKAKNIAEKQSLITLFKNKLGNLSGVNTQYANKLEEFDNLTNILRR